jgi:O-antigen ligase
MSMSKNASWAVQTDLVSFPLLAQQIVGWMRVLTLLFIFFLPVWPGYAELRVFGSPNLAPTRLLSLALFPLLIAAFFLSRERQQVFLKRVAANWPFFMLILLFYILKGVSAYRAVNSVLSMYEFIKLDLLTIFPIFFYTLFILKDREDIRRVMVILCGAACVVALATIVEAILKTNIYMRFLPITSSSIAQNSPGGFRDSVYRAQGSFEHPLALSEFMSAILPFCIYLLLASKRGMERLFYIAATLLIFAAIFLTRSRAGIGAVAVACSLLVLVLIVRWVKGSRNYVAQYLVILQIPALLCFLVVAGVAYSEYFVGKSVEERRSTFLRVEMLERGVPLVMKNPVLGLGQGRGSDAVGIKAARGYTTIDNYYLSLALNAGIPALILFVLILATWLLRLWRIARTADRSASLLAAVLAISISVFALHASIQSLISVFPVLFLVFAMALVLEEDTLALAPRNG